MLLGALEIEFLLRLGGARRKLELLEFTLRARRRDLPGRRRARRRAHKSVETRMRRTRDGPGHRTLMERREGVTRLNPHVRDDSKRRASSGCRRESSDVANTLLFESITIR